MMAITEERRNVVGFALSADLPRVRGLVVTGPKSPAIGTVEDLAGKTVHVRNIYKYYVAYKLMAERREATRKAHKQVAPGTGK